MDASLVSSTATLHHEQPDCITPEVVALPSGVEMLMRYAELLFHVEVDFIFLTSMHDLHITFNHCSFEG